MKSKKLVIIISVCIILVITICICLYILKSSSKKIEEVEEVSEIETNTVEQEEKEPLVVALNREEEQQVIEEPEVMKTPAELTQEINDINGPIGILNIPKTGLNTQIYSKVTVNQMEQMPCFLYTTGGLNQVGTTIFVGHNRANGLLFSNNNMIEESDEIYFTDLNGAEKKYVVYSKFVTSNDDVSFYNAEVDSPVIAMQCCLTPENEEQVIIIMAKAEN